MSYGASSWADWVLDEDKALPLLKAAWDAGIQTWDTADMYSNVFHFLTTSLTLGIVGSHHWEGNQEIQHSTGEIGYPHEMQFPYSR